uniref:Uncharacterized protein n=1 Tax=Ixodes ricinus TaxID=34613 RepID=A0A147BF74_IXORI
MAVSALYLVYITLWISSYPRPCRVRVWLVLSVVAAEPPPAFLLHRRSFVRLLFLVGTSSPIKPLFLSSLLVFVSPPFVTFLVEVRGRRRPRR